MCKKYILYIYTNSGHEMAQLIEALRYRSEGNGFSWVVSLEISLKLYYGMALMLTRCPSRLKTSK